MMISNDDGVRPTKSLHTLTPDTFLEYWGTFTPTQPLPFGWKSFIRLLEAGGAPPQVVKNTVTKVMRNPNSQDRFRAFRYEILDAMAMLDYDPGDATDGSTQAPFTADGEWPQVTCAYCGAAPGNPCKTAYGKVAMWSHTARMKAAEKTNNE